MTTLFGDIVQNKSPDLSNLLSTMIIESLTMSRKLSRLQDHQHGQT